MRGIHLIIAILALSLFGIVTGDLRPFSGLSLDARRAIGLIAFGTNVAIDIYGAVNSHRIAWSAYLAFVSRRACAPGRYNTDHRSVAGFKTSEGYRMRGICHFA